MNSNETKSALHTETPTSYATLGYSLGIEPSKAIFVASLLIGVACYYLRSRTESSGSKRDTIWDIFSTIIFVVSLSFGASTWLELTTLGPSVVSDFTQDYAAALALRHGVPIFGKAFESFAAQQFQVSIFEPGIRNFHPPFNAVLFLPLSYVPYPRAFIIWNAVSVLCYVTLVYLLLSSYRIATSRVLLLSSLLLLWVPFTSNIALGQTSIVLALFICGGFFLLEYYGKERMAGCLFAVATLVKLFPGLILVYLVFRCHWRCLCYAISILALGLILTFFIVGHPDTIFYLRYVVPEHARSFASYPFNLSLSAVLSTILAKSAYSIPAVLAPGLVPWATWTINIVLLVSLCILTRRVRAPQEVDFVFSLFCITMLLISPITWAHTCVAILLPLSILLRDSVLAGRNSALRQLLIVLFVFSLPVNQVLFTYSPGEVPWYAMLYVKAGFFGLLMLWIIFYSRLTFRLKSEPINVRP